MRRAAQDVQRRRRQHPHPQDARSARRDDDIDFNFQIAKALGCKAITTERNDELAKRLAPFAEKHKIWVAFHNHTNNVPTIEKLDPLLDIGEYIGVQFRHRPLRRRHQGQVARFP